MTTTSCARFMGVWRLKLTGPEVLLDDVGEFVAEVEGLGGTDSEHNNLAFGASEKLAQLMGYESYDDLPERYTPMAFEPAVLHHNEFVTPDGDQQWFVTVYSAGQGYGGSEEGGWWFDTGEVVQMTAVNSREGAEALRDALASTEFPQTGKRSSVLGGEDYDIAINIRPGTSFPEFKPRYE
jgi:hypothetical protein